ncbi:MAG TPA: MFS transporter, partial [Holophagaceae bacterium]
MSLQNRLQALRSGFSRSFWVANSLELLERFAFYGSKAVLAVYLVDKLGLGRNGNTLVGLYGFAVYFLPILAGPIVDRYGFRRSLIACFSIFSLGYFAIGWAGLPSGHGLVARMGMEPYIIGALLLTAVGGSLIKPCVVGTVARTTSPETKSLGYSIYYSLVNLGGALGPMLALAVRENLGIEYVLVMSAATSALNLLGTFFFFKEPKGSPSEEAPRHMLQVLKDMLRVFTNLRFISFLVIFSGFWIMFWQIFYGLPFYVRDALHYPKFELIETVDAWSIILLSVPVTAMMKKVRPILAMTSGFAVACLAWLLIGLVPTMTASIAGIMVFAVGEAMQAPRFYEYV